MPFSTRIFQSGYANPIDAAIQAHCSFDVGEYHKLDEQPYDFVRKRLSVLVACPSQSADPRDQRGAEQRAGCLRVCGR